MSGGSVMMLRLTVILLFVLPLTSLYALYRFYLVLLNDKYDISGFLGFIFSLLSFIGAIYVCVRLGEVIDIKGLFL
jgi:hypothetical protein